MFIPRTLAELEGRPGNAALEHEKGSGYWHGSPSGRSIELIRLRLMDHSLTEM